MTDFLTSIAVKALLSLVLIMSPVISYGKNKTLPVNPFNLKDPLIGKKAPEPVISEWLNGKGHPLSSYRGKVVVIEFFQLWCPGCNKFSIPLMKEWSNKFKNNKNIIFISIHTVFEGHSFQNPKRLKKFVKEKKIKHLVGIDKHGLKGHVPLTMQKYRTGGTPAMAIIDKKGIIRFKYFGTFQKEPVEKLINLLLQEKYKK